MERFDITHSAVAIPERSVSNDELATIMDTSDEWIYSRTGIHRRHVVTDENTSDLAIEVAQKLLASSGLKANDLDFIIVATMSPDSLSPNTASIVQGAIGANNAFAYDISAACSGMAFAISTASALLATRYQQGLVIGAEVLSKLVDWQDRSTAVLFGDGAAGVLMSRTDKEQGLLGEDLVSLGDKGAFLTAGTLANTNAFTNAGAVADPFFKMDGREVYNFASREVPISMERALKRAELSADKIDVYIMHQANSRIVKAIAKRFGQPIEKFPMNMVEYGNTSAASIGILLHELRTSGQVESGKKIALVGFGGGLTIGTLIIQL